jgi:hypothetical protein
MHPTYQMRIEVNRKKLVGRKRRVKEDVARMARSLSETLNGNAQNQAKTSSAQLTETNVFQLGRQVLASRGSTKR